MRTATSLQPRSSTLPITSDEADDILHLVHDGRRDGARPSARRRGRGRSPPGSASRRLASAPIGPGFARDLGQRLLEGRELLAAELAKTAGLGLARQRRVDADEIVRLGTAVQSLRPRSGSGSGSVLAFWILLRDGVGVVGQIDARQVGRIGLRHLLGAVAQAHDAGRRARDHRLGLREEHAVRVALGVDLAAKSLLNFCAMSRASSRCCFWSSPTGTCVAR